MKIKKILNNLLPITLLSLSGCAAGSATAGYAVKADSATRAEMSTRSTKADTADALTSEAEQRIVDRAKRETLAELAAKNH